ncbi:alcohol dehydrogenase [Enterovirga aerilata]|uniref:alcohol dehydrogenase n=1 Tax=Enterovirga aerilata TaxID=2730920 RepID=A0A849I8S2_9HYPH|nr:alcohol dehydrogenase [Enterovirga sp. DB1703]NNM72470.1 alcohol dehydrogenase catalytic domain-containing protein [Enterovirga sp. DB1703]
MKSYQITAFGRPLELRCTAEPEPQGTEVLVRIERAGVCHSDLHIWHGYFDLGGGKRFEMTQRMTLPFTLGHEIVGEVIAVGPDGDRAAIGRKGIVHPWIGCGSCPACDAGEELRCPKPRTIGTRRDGGYSDHVLVPHGRYIVPYGDLEPGLAATCACSGLTAYSALKKLPRMTAEDSLLVIGAGGVGLACVGLAGAVTPARVIVSDVGAAKREAALAQGAHAALDASGPEGRAEILETAGGRPPRAAIDFVGSPETLRLAMEAVDLGGTVVSVGLYGGELPISTALLPLRQITIRGSYVGSLEELRELVGIMQARKVRSVPVRTRPMAEVNAILADLEAGRIVGRTVMAP